MMENYVLFKLNLYSKVIIYHFKIKIIIKLNYVNNLWILSH